MNHFLILGNGGGGTSLLRGLMNAHSQCEVLFEHKGQRTDSNPAGYVGPEKELECWCELAAEAGASGICWGNKIPIEQLMTRNYTIETAIKLIDHFKIIFIQRRFSRVYKPGHAPEPYYRENWKWGHRCYWQMRERKPDGIIAVSFEDLLLRTSVELERICAFIGVIYEPWMILGTKETGYPSYNQDGIDYSRL